jgi:hypothetical protein
LERSILLESWPIGLGWSVNDSPFRKPEDRRNVSIKSQDGRRKAVPSVAFTSCQASSVLARQHLIQPGIRSTGQKDLSCPIAGVQSYIILINATTKPICPVNGRIWFRPNNKESRTQNEFAPRKNAKRNQRERQELIRDDENMYNYSTVVGKGKHESDFGQTKPIFPQAQ